MRHYGASSLFIGVSNSFFLSHKHMKKSWDSILITPVGFSRTWNVTHIYVWHDWFDVWHDSYLSPGFAQKAEEPVTRPLMGVLRVCDMTHSYVWHDSFICVTRLIHTCDMAPLHICHNSFICGTWLLPFAGLCEKGRGAHNEATYGFLASVWHDSFICVTWLIHTCDKTHWYVWHDSYTCGTCRIHMSDMTPTFRRALWKRQRSP